MRCNRDGEDETDDTGNYESNRECVVVRILDLVNGLWSAGPSTSR